MAEGRPTTFGPGDVKPGDALTLILNILRSWDFGDDTGETLRKHYAEALDDLEAMVEALRELLDGAREQDEDEYEEG